MYSTRTIRLVENQFLAVKRLYKLQRHRKRTNLEKNLAWRRFSNVLKTFETSKKISQISRNSQTFFPGIPVPKKELFPGNFPVPGIPVQTLLPIFAKKVKKNAKFLTLKSLSENMCNLQKAMKITEVTCKCKNCRF